MKAGISELGDYLLSKELYWPVATHGNNLPSLTIGALLLAQARLEAAGERIETLTTQINGIRSKWRVAWETKAGREVRARSGLWRNYLQDYRDNPGQYADAYPYEVRHRVMLHFLLIESPILPTESEEIAQMDALVRDRLLPAGFIWDVNLASGFPPPVYWYLYGKLKS